MKWIGWGVVGVIAAIAIIASCVHDNTMATVFPQLKNPRIHFDLYLHAGIFVILTGCLLLCISSTMVALATSALFGLGLEVMQGVAVTGREFSMLDIAANIIGLTIGFVVFTIYKKLVPNSPRRGGVLKFCELSELWEESLPAKGAKRREIKTKYF